VHIAAKAEFESLGVTTSGVPGATNGRVSTGGSGCGVPGMGFGASTAVASSPVSSPVWAGAAATLDVRRCCCWPHVLAKGRGVPVVNVAGSRKVHPSSPSTASATLSNPSCDVPSSWTIGNSVACEIGLGPSSCTVGRVR